MTSIRLRLTLLGLLLTAAWPGLAAAQGLDAVKARYTKYEYRIPMRDGKRLFTAVYVPKDTAQKYPILLTRTPYSVGPYGADQLQGQPRPVAVVRQGRLHLRLPGRARPLDVGGRRSSTCGRTIPTRRAAGHRREQRHLRHHRLAGQARPQQQRQGRPVGHLVSRLLHRGGHDRRPSRRSRPPRRRRRSSTGSSATTGTTTAPCSCRTASTSSAASAGRGRSRPRRSSRASSTTRRTATTSSCSMGPLANADRTLLQGRGRLLERGDDTTAPTTTSGRRATCGRT